LQKKALEDPPWIVAPVPTAVHLPSGAPDWERRCASRGWLPFGDPEKSSPITGRG